MRIRSTKPEFWRSRLIASVDWEVRFVLKALESYVDDNGVGKDDLELIVSDTFSRDLVREPSRTLKRVQVAINTLHEAGLVHRYQHNGTDLLYISWWESIQYINRPSKGRLPRPDGTLEYGDSEIGAPDLSPQEPSSSFSAGTGEQGSGDQRIRGTVDQGISHSPDKPGNTNPDRFEEFWDTYDHKLGRKKAETAYRAALKKPGVTEDLLINSAASYIEWQKAEDKHPTYTKHAATWLHGEHWADERAGRPARQTRVQEHLSLVERLAAEEANQPRQIGSDR